MELEEGKSAQKLHIGMTCPPLAGHLKPALAIAEELLRRGHKVTHFGSARVEKDFAAIGAHFVPLKVEEHERHLEVLTESSFLRQMTAIPAFFRQAFAPCAVLSISWRIGEREVHAGP